MNPISIITLILAVVGNIGLIVVAGLYLKQQKVFAEITQGVTKKDLKTILKTVADSLKKVGLELGTQNQSIGKIIHKDRFHIQKLGFLRYNPYADTGGDQSFCLCLLDETDTGIVITSLHSREQTRIYAKAIAHGKPAGYELSREETEALSQAIKKATSRKK